MLRAALEGAGGTAGAAAVVAVVVVVAAAVTTVVVTAVVVGMFACNLLRISAPACTLSSHSSRSSGTFSSTPRMAASSTRFGKTFSRQNSWLQCGHGAVYCRSLREPVEELEDDALEVGLTLLLEPSTQSAMQA
jgi:hypothetical protein